MAAPEDARIKPSLELHFPRVDLSELAKDEGINNDRVNLLEGFEIPTHLIAELVPQTPLPPQAFLRKGRSDGLESLKRTHQMVPKAFLWIKNSHQMSNAKPSISYSIPLGCICLVLVMKKIISSYRSVVRRNGTRSCGY
jgi:hypothetical protein